MLLMLLVSVACKAPLQPPTQVVHDSIYVEKTTTVTLHDTVFKTNPSQVTIMYPCDSGLKPNLKPVEKAFKNAKLKVERQGRFLKIDCNCDTLAIKAQLKTIIEKEVTARDKLRSEIIEKQILTPIPKVIIILAWIGGLSLLLIVIYISYKIFYPQKKYA